MARLIRIDSELARRGLARSRTHAAELLAQGRVTLDGAVVTKPARQVNPAQAIEVLPQADPQEPHPHGPRGPRDCQAPRKPLSGRAAAQGRGDYVSRGAHKLAGALDALEARGLAPRVQGRRCLDAGASTGGFTDVLLRRGAAHVTAVDVGYGQLAWSLQCDARVSVMDRTNVRTLDPRSVEPAPELVVGDMSFISLAVVLPPLLEAADGAADLLLMVKPQFEVGRQRLGRGGVVRDPALRIEAVLGVAERAHELGAAVRAITASPLPGPAGNVEYFLAMRAGAGGGPGDLTGPELRAQAQRAVDEGPAGAGAPGRSHQ